jgi:hypothetical protein
MSRLTDLYKKVMYGQAGMDMPGQGMSEGTSGLFGQGGQQSGGLIDFNKMNNQEGGLLQNIPQTALLGSALFGQGMQGKDPFSALLPAVTQTAQLQKYMTPKLGALKQAYDPNKINEDGSKGGVVYASDTEIRAKGLTPALPTETIAQTPGGGLTVSKSYGGGTGTANQKNLDLANEIKSTNFELNNVGNTLLTNLRKSKIGGIGATISALDSVGSQLNQAAQVFGFGKSFNDTGSGAIDSVLTKDFKLDKEAVNYEKVKSNVVNMAFLMAKADEPGGRFSDKDIALRMRELGISQNPEKTAQVIEGVLELRNRNAKNKYKLYSSGLELESFPELEQQKKEFEAIDPLGLGL